MVWTDFGKMNYQCPILLEKVNTDYNKHEPTTKTYAMCKYKDGLLIVLDYALDVEDEFQKQKKQILTNESKEIKACIVEMSLKDLHFYIEQLNIKD